MVGKWHLGHADKKFWPQNRGFDHFYGNLVGEVDYFTKERGGCSIGSAMAVFLKEDGYFTTLIGNEAVRHHRQLTIPSKPLFLYVASLAPHASYQAPKQDIERLCECGRRCASAHLCGHDHRPGYSSRADRYCAETEEHARQLTIVFSSDNGGATSALFATGARSPEERAESGGVELGAKTPASNGDFRGGKGSLHEGGVRVPTIFYSAHQAQTEHASTNHWTWSM